MPHFDHARDDFDNSSRSGSFPTAGAQSVAKGAWESAPPLWTPQSALVFSLRIATVPPMPLTPATAEVPLATDAHGVVRVGGTRVTLDSVLGAFRTGATAEEIAQQFPTLVLADIYQVIAHFLNHTAEVESYLTTRQKEAGSLRREIEINFDPRGIRARLLSRRPGATT